MLLGRRKLSSIDCICRVGGVLVCAGIILIFSVVFSLLVHYFSLLLPVVSGWTSISLARCLFILFGMFFIVIGVLCGVIAGWFK